jgi:hydroxymethylglutaryl-CoA lyase
MGIKTGVDLDALVDIGEWISKTLNRRNESRAGAALYVKRQSSESPSQTTVTSTSTTSESNDLLLVSRTPSTATITLNNPRKGNVLTAPMIKSLRSTLASLSSDTTIQTIILTNNGKYFCTGMDLSSSGPATTGTTKAQLENLLSTFECVNSCPKTTIALVHGDCFGGGVGLAFCCDIRIIINPLTKFVLSEVKRGLVPATISKYVVREWGPALAREAMITGRPVTAKELLQKHVVHAVVETEEEAKELVEKYVKLLEMSAPRAVGQVKELVNRVAERKGETESIEKVFEDMMAPSDEAKFGIGEFRKGIRDVDWGRWYREKIGGKPKL